MRLLIFLILFLLTFKPVQGLDNLSRHVHGEFYLDLAVHEKQLLILIKAPADSVLGFEHKAKTAKEKKKVEEVHRIWTQKFSSLIQIEATDCTLNIESFKQIFQKDSSHSEFIGEFLYSCQSSLKKKTLHVNLKKNFPRIEKIHSQLINSSSKTLSKTYPNIEIKFEL